MAAKVTTPVREEESGIALVLTILLLLMVSAIGISALNRANDERTGSTASRRVVANLAAAEAGMRIVQNQLAAAGGTGVPSQAALNQTNLLVDSSSTGVNVRSGVIGNPTPQPIKAINTIRGTPGGELRIGASTMSTRNIYRVQVVAESPNRGSASIEAQFSVRVSGGTY